MTAFEDKIRDSLADDLGVLDGGLTLVQKEFRLPNAFGASGRIDILAKDQFGNFVIIEIKRSDQAARQALHELFKYASIIHRQLGVPPSKIRAILVSTTWHELAIPFSEYLETTGIHTEGYEISVNAVGTIVSTSLFQPIPLYGPLEISDSQCIYFYEDDDRRNDSIEALSQRLTELGIRDHALFQIDLIGPITIGQCLYGIYVVFSSPFHLLNQRQQDGLKLQLGWDDELDEPDENFLVALTEQFDSYDQMEIGYPEKLRAMAETWDIRVAVRAGRFKGNEQMVTDESLVSDTMQIEGGASHYLHCIVSPRFTERWDRAIRDATLVALGNSAWTKAVPLILSEIHGRDPNASVAIRIYNVADTYLALAKLCNRDLRFFPALEVISKESKGVRIMFSTVVWNKKPLSFTPTEFFNGACGSLDDWLMASHFGAQYKFDDAAREMVGLETPLWEFWIPSDGEAILRKVDCETSITRRPCAEIPAQGLQDLLSTNSKFFNIYRDQISETTLGLIDEPDS